MKKISLPSPYVSSASDPSEVHLTTLSSCSGCASKISAKMLTEILAPTQGIFQAANYPDLLVGLESPDDAAVWRIDEQRGLVLTTDFFTPIVDNPYDYGRIAATNAISDIYAMGGTPFMALNIAALPPDLDPAILQQIMLGGGEAARDAGVVIAGGHTVRDAEPKYGLAVVGFVDLEHMFTKGGGQPGDALVLSKPIGFGTVTTALKRGKAAAEDVAVVTRWMSRLNRNASQLAREFDLRAVTDVTGYSLLGHSSEMALAGKVQYRLDFNQIPFLPEALPYARQGIFPGGADDNRDFYGSRVTFERELADWQKMMLFDPQTSGGLLMAVPQKHLAVLLARAEEMEQPIWAIGEIAAGSGVHVI
jgi:selenide,water dikinase